MIFEHRDPLRVLEQNDLLFLLSPLKCRYRIRMIYSLLIDSVIDQVRKVQCRQETGLLYSVHRICPINQLEDTSRGFESRPSLPQIRPIGHGAKTPSHGSLSHGSGASRESRGGSDSILDLHVQSSMSHQSQEYPTSSRDVPM